MSAPIFDDRLRRLRRERATRLGGDRFLHARAFEDCLDRLIDISNDFKATLVIGDAGEMSAAALTRALPNSNMTFADDADLMQVEPGSFDLCIAIGLLESNNDLTTTAFALRHSLSPGGLLLGAVVGGNSLPRLRTAMIAADRSSGTVSPRVHPSIDGPSLAALLGSVGLVQSVVDVERVDVRYPDLDRLIADLRAMGCTNILAARSRRPLMRQQLDIARAIFLTGGDSGIERFEILHFAAWSPQI